MQCFYYPEDFIMAYIPCDCLGYYDFDQVVVFAKQKFIDGYSTIDLLKNAKTQKERDEVTLIAFFDLDVDCVTELSLHCRFAEVCTVKNCWQTFKGMIEKTIGKSHS